MKFTVRMTCEEFDVAFTDDGSCWSSDAVALAWVIRSCMEATTSHVARTSLLAASVLEGMDFGRGKTVERSDGLYAKVVAAENALLDAATELVEAWADLDRERANAGKSE